MLDTGYWMLVAGCSVAKIYPPLEDPVIGESGASSTFAQLGQYHENYEKKRE